MSIPKIGNIPKHIKYSKKEFLILIEFHPKLPQEYKDKFAELVEYDHRYTFIKPDGTDYYQYI